MTENPFVLHIDAYKRNLDTLGQYLKDTTLYLNLMTGKSSEECLNFIKKQLRPDGEFPFRDPRVQFFERNADGDRFPRETTLSEYFSSVIKEKDIIAPTLTTYLHPSVKESLLVKYIDGNVKARYVAKKAMFEAKMAKNKLVEVFKKNEQTNKKLKNNSISGAHCSAGTPFYNKSSHSTLTSNCRTTSAYGNANNEKFLCGNRHYWSPDIVRNNIISIINNTDYSVLALCMEQFGIRHPTVSETIECYRYSADLYWKGTRDHIDLELLISKLSPIQRSAFVYTGDLYHLKKYNNSLVYGFISKLSSKGLTEHPTPELVINSASEDIRHLASQICSKELRGKRIVDIIGTPDYGIYASTIENITNTLDEYFNLIRALWITNNVPASVGVFPNSIRRTAITSDTDSTIFTVQDWVLWYQEELSFNDRAIAVAATMIFLSAQTIVHILALMSINSGMVKERLHQVAMKNEFFFPVFCPTDTTKHYYALVGCQEGNVFEKLEKEIKGVHLKASNAPKAIIKDAENMMLFILNSVVEGKKISIRHMAKWVADKEREVVSSIKRGDHEYFKLTQIKEPKSYKHTENAPAYKQYLLWQYVFAPKYGDAPPPPYSAIKVGMGINTPTKTRQWIDSIVDKDIAYKLEQWLVMQNTNTFGSMLLLPEQVLSSNGIPEEIALAIGIRNIVKDTTNIYYKILETLGLYIVNKQKTLLCMDIY